MQLRPLFAQQVKMLPSDNPLTVEITLAADEPEFDLVAGDKVELTVFAMATSAWLTVLSSNVVQPRLPSGGCLSSRPCAPDCLHLRLYEAALRDPEVDAQLHRGAQKWRITAQNQGLGLSYPELPGMLGLWRLDAGIYYSDVQVGPTSTQTTTFTLDFCVLAADERCLHHEKPFGYCWLWVLWQHRGAHGLPPLLTSLAANTPLLRTLIHTGEVSLKLVEPALHELYLYWNGSTLAIGTSSEDTAQLWRERCLTCQDASSCTHAGLRARLWQRSKRCRRSVASSA